MRTDPHLFKQGESKQSYEQSEMMTSGHLACPGCGAAIAMRLALKSLGPDTIVVIPACCWAVIPGPFPYSNMKVPLMHTAFETTGAVLSGIRAALDINENKTTQIMGWAGDGGTFDIGLQSLSSAAERNEDVIYVCYDNEAYMNTGIQQSGATPEFTWTTTTPVDFPKMTPKKNIDRIMASHGIPYLATTSPAFPHDLMAKFEKAKKIKGFRFIHILASCTAGWKIDSEKSIEVMRKAVDSKVFPIFEVENGEKYTINIEPKGIPVQDYLSMQGRFRHMTQEQIESYQQYIDKSWNWLKKQAR
ncbi:MAG: Pyruvate synthase subunit PorB [bacterium ADurb.Bin270]|nr:MAG: Pyruvate synthase subunit PorB [bacterium ADurb.Bin270]